MTDVDPFTRLTRAARRYQQLQDARDELHAAIAAAVESGVTVSRVAKATPFDERSVRRIAREQGVAPQPAGRKPR